MLHVDRLSTSDLRELITSDNWPSISIYMPTHKLGALSEDRIRIRNLLRAAEKRLEDAGFKRTASHDVLGPAYKLIEDTRFWSHLSEGLSLHLAPGRSRIYRLPVAFREFLSVGRRFHVKPLFAVQRESPEFCLLALSEKACKLYRGGRYSMEEVQLADLPSGMAEALHIEDLRRNLRVHTGDVEKSVGVYHVQGSSSEEAVVKRWLRDYCYALDRAVCDYLGRGDTYLLVAAVEPIFAIYREANRYPRFIPRNVRPNMKHTTQDELRQEAWRHIEDEQSAARQSLLRRYGELRGSGLAADCLARLLPACFHGQVDTLFIDMDAESWGRFDVQRNRIHANAASGAVELYDLAARQAWMSGARIHALASGELRAEDGIAAILRYSYTLSPDAAVG